MPRPLPRPGTRVFSSSGATSARCRNWSQTPKRIYLRASHGAMGKQFCAKPCSWQIITHTTWGNWWTFDAWWELGSETLLATSRSRHHLAGCRQDAASYVSTITLRLASGNSKAFLLSRPRGEVYAPAVCGRPPSLHSISGETY